MAEATIEFTIANPGNAEDRAMAAFEAIWRVIT
jgi:hypothetical protein